MKIAFVVDGFPALSETFILNQITGLIDLGHNVEIFAKSKPKELKMHRDVHSYNLIKKTCYFSDVIPRNKMKRIWRALSLTFKNLDRIPISILKTLNIFKYKKKALNLEYLLYAILLFDKDILHFHFGPNGELGIMLKEIGFAGKCIISFHGYDVNIWPQQHGRDVYKKLFKYGDVFTANSYFTRTRLVALGCDESKIVILPGGIKIRQLGFSEREKIKEKPIKILTVGRLVEEKGHEYAIKAISKLVKKYKNLIYIIAGDGPLRNKFELLVTNLGIKNHIKFLGAVDQDEALDLYEQSDIFILPSVIAKNGGTEAQGLVLQEAQACEIPVLTTNIGGIPEGMLDKKSGFIVPEKNTDALAEKLVYLIEHPEIWPEMGRAGRKFVEEKFDVKGLDKRLVKIYNGLLSMK